MFEDLKAYLASLQKMKTRVAGRGYPGHGAVMESATEKIAFYLQHREQREEEVIRVLRYGKLDVNEGEHSPDPKGEWSPLELVKAIYRDVPENLHLPASHGVLQVLLKLEDEGRTSHDMASGKWRLESGRATL